MNYATQVVGKSYEPAYPCCHDCGGAGGQENVPPGVVKYLYRGSPLHIMYKDKAGKASGGSDSLVGVGEILLLVYLTCDSLTGAVQERLKLKHLTKPGLMMAMHKWSVDYLAVALAFTGEGLEFIGFIQRHPADTHDEC